jgi:hypothetical protein
MSWNLFERIINAIKSYNKSEQVSEVSDRSQQWPESGSDTPQSWPESSPEQSESSHEPSPNLQQTPNTTQQS